MNVQIVERELFRS